MGVTTKLPIHSPRHAKWKKHDCHPAFLQPASSPAPRPLWKPKQSIAPERPLLPPPSVFADHEGLTPFVLGANSPVDPTKLFRLSVRAGKPSRATATSPSATRSGLSDGKPSSAGNRNGARRASFRLSGNSTHFIEKPFKELGSFHAQS